MLVMVYAHANRSGGRLRGHSSQLSIVLVVIGVSGSGKTTVATILARRLGWPFEEGDSLHSESNIRKMSAGLPLTDADRQDWLLKVAGWVEARLDRGGSGLITCSALKRRYRDVINRRGAGLVFVFLAGSRATIAARLAARTGHFMPPALLDSQLADLEEPGPDEPAIRVEIDKFPDAIAQEVLERMALPD
jgi:gluconokinase